MVLLADTLVTIGLVYVVSDFWLLLVVVLFACAVAEIRSGHARRRLPST